MNSDINKLHAYPFEQLLALKQGIVPPAQLPHIALSIGEPKHTAPAFVLQAYQQHLTGLSSYPLTIGQQDLREAIAGWLHRRFDLPDNAIDPASQVIPVTGTREALFSFAQAVVNRNIQGLVMMPNPFYQIYEGACLLAGAEPHYLNTDEANNYLPDFENIDTSTWQRTQLIYICTPGNPTGSVMPMEQLQKLIELSLRYNFVIASDECYSEIYPDSKRKPVGLLQAAQQMGHSNFKNCVVFHSLSKRSNLPGMRSGFVAGDAEVLKHFLRYRTYHGCAMAPPAQMASIAAWNDENHVQENLELYRKKFRAVLHILDGILDVKQPDAGFYLWARTPVDDRDFARGLFAQQHVTVLPGQFLSRSVYGYNPGQNHIRMALVATETECIEAAHRIAAYVKTI